MNSTASSTHSTVRNLMRYRPFDLFTFLKVRADGKQHLSNLYSEIRCIALFVLQTSKGFWVFCSVNHFSEGGVNARCKVAEKDSRLLKNSEGNRDGEWIFCRRKEVDVALFLQVTRIRKIRKI